MSKQEEFDLSVLDMDMAMIEDLPGFEVPSNGEYVLRLQAKGKVVKDVACLELGFEVMECVKKDKEEDPDAVAGSKFSSLFQLNNKDEEARRISLGVMKQVLNNVAEQTGQGNVLVLVRDHLKDAIVTATIKRRQDKEDPEKFYPVIKNLRLQ